MHPLARQVRDVMGGRSAPAPHTAGLRLASSGREVAPALGPSWASCVDVRLFLSRQELQDMPAAPAGHLVGCPPARIGHRCRPAPETVHGI